MYKFIYEDRDDKTGELDTSIEITVHTLDPDVHSLCTIFRDFLNASGYCIKEEIGILYESELGRK